MCDACLYSVCRERPASAKTAIDILLPSLCLQRFGDRLLMVNGQDFHCISRKKAAEVLRSCDQLSVTMEISRIISKLKPKAVVHSLYIYNTNGAEKVLVKCPHFRSVQSGTWVGKRCPV